MNDNSSLPSTSINKEKASKFKGVYRCGRKWKAQVQVAGTQHYLGVFDSEELAAFHYRRFLRQQHQRPYYLAGNSTCNQVVGSSSSHQNPLAFELQQTQHILSGSDGVEIPFAAELDPSLSLRPTYALSSSRERSSAVDPSTAFPNKAMDISAEATLPILGSLQHESHRDRDVGSVGVRSTPASYASQSTTSHDKLSIAATPSRPLIRSEQSAFSAGPGPGSDLAEASNSASTVWRSITGQNKVDEDTSHPMRQAMQLNNNEYIGDVQNTLPSPPLATTASTGTTLTSSSSTASMLSTLMHAAAAAAEEESPSSTVETFASGQEHHLQRHQYLQRHQQPQLVYHPNAHQQNQGYQYGVHYQPSLNHRQTPRQLSASASTVAHMISAEEWDRMWTRRVLIGRVLLLNARLFAADELQLRAIMQHHENQRHNRRSQQQQPSVEEENIVEEDAILQRYLQARHEWHMRLEDALERLLRYPTELH